MSSYLTPTMNRHTITRWRFKHLVESSSKGKKNERFLQAFTYPLMTPWMFLPNLCLTPDRDVGPKQWRSSTTRAAWTTGSQKLWNENLEHGRTYVHSPSQVQYAHNLFKVAFCKYVHVYIPVVPGQAGGGSFQKEKNYIAQKEFAYRMCARQPTSAMPKSFLCCERAFCRSMVVMFCALKWSVLMSWCLLRGQVMWWSRHLMRCNGLCCVMSRDAMRCHGDELSYSSTTLYYKVLLCTTPILLRTTNTTLYYSSTTLYYKVLLKYYSVLLQY